MEKIALIPCLAIAGVALYEGVRPWAGSFWKATLFITVGVGLLITIWYVGFMLLYAPAIEAQQKKFHDWAVANGIDPTPPEEIAQ